MSEGRAHWNALYTSRDETDLAWFEQASTVSLRLIAARISPGDPIVDIGGGASRLVDGLLAAGLGPVTVLDLSGAALGISRARLGPRAAGVTWVEADVTRWRPPRPFALWHDRAVLHFLTDPDDRASYVRTLATALAPGGHAVLSTFAPNGPDRCAGLPVQRYSPRSLAALLQDHAPGGFSLEEAHDHIHQTPAGKKQEFQVSVFRRLSSSGVGDR